ncbi:PA domain-containing protein [Colletotrichum plurivorum]|uniref:PA domain-containing protein n=1 Tax=Colletotrichum plurivorum TaxID=2175906 RepID=A0A8H6JTY5_9PEZI|nr:PA domain-containing protein [Colletotrichum plurivorum]
MAKSSWVLRLATLAAGLIVASATEDKKAYIVQYKPLGGTALERRVLLQASFQSVSGNPNDLLYTYENAIHGYAALLTEEEVNEIRQDPDVIYVTPDQKFTLFTTRTPQFLGLDDENLLRGHAHMDQTTFFDELNDADGSESESNIVIGVVDSGAWPEHPSYNDEGMGPIPAHWKGECETGEGWSADNCNRKLIGARFFSKRLAASNETLRGDWRSARDAQGHGTHCSTTAAGSEVRNASIFGHASGTARGMAKNARLAIYRVCTLRYGCDSSEFIAAIDKAIYDGVNVLSLSLGFNYPTFKPSDPFVSATFTAMQNGIFVVMAGGNEGPSLSSVTNLSPWVLTVAASTLDREFPAHVTIGNGTRYTGTSLYTKGFIVDDANPLQDGEELPLVYSRDAQLEQGSALTINARGPRYPECKNLDPSKVAGKAVVCFGYKVDDGLAVKAAGGRAMISIGFPGLPIRTSPHLIPALNIEYLEGVGLLQYAETENATVVFDFEGTRLGVPAPKMAWFSSRGPNYPVPGLLKPDITGPGVDILAANTNETIGVNDPRQHEFTLMSGTSMATPHLAGIAAIIMARRPDWSIAAVRSAIMTTAYTTLKGSGSGIQEHFSERLPKLADPSAFGNGHVNPKAALNPGLIYNVTALDYGSFICAVYPEDSQVVQAIMKTTDFTCDAGTPHSVYDLNYPSFSAVYNATTERNETQKVTFKRTVTNVGTAGTYKVDVSLNDPSLIDVSVKPDTLTFGEYGEEKSYEVVVTMSAPPGPTSVEMNSWGRIVWSDGDHKVASTIVFLYHVPKPRW